MTLPLTFPGAHGATLAARLHLASGPPRASALFAHCFTCSKDLKAAVCIADAMALRGISVLRFDFTGLGQSEGDFVASNFSSNVDDLIAAAEFLRTTHGAPQILVGHSLGGAAILAAAERIPECVAVATIGAPADPAHVRHLLRDVADDVAARGEAEVEIAGRRFRVAQQFFDDLDEHSLDQRIGQLRKALLICHAPRDNIVGIDNARLIFEAAKHPKSFLSLDDADHLLTRVGDAHYVGQMVAAWAERYLRASEVSAPAEGEVVVASRSEAGKFANDILVGRHRMRSDEPPAIPGGTDTGPAPYDLLLAALGSCTSMTLRMYADRKEWPLEGVRVTLRHDKIHARDCEQCTTTTGKLDRIERAIEIAGPLSDEQRARLIEIANKCPVHRTLHSEVVVHTTEAEK